MTYAPSQLAFKYCVGQGAELGASRQNAFGLPDCPNIAPSDGERYLFPQDLEDYRTYEAEQRRYSDQITRVDLIGDFQNIPLADNSLDYLISSHVIEHEPNPIAGLIESQRVLKEGGIFFCIFPKRNAERSYDAFRALTTQESFIQSYNEKVTVHTAGQTWRCHYNVFSLQSMLTLINWVNSRHLTRFRIEAVEETDSKVGNGHTIILRKVAAAELAEAPPIGAIEAAINDQDYAGALLAARARLSLDFFQPEVLYAAALLCHELDAREEGREFFRQALILNPESEHYRQEFFRVFNEIYSNPLV